MRAGNSTFPAFLNCGMDVGFPNLCTFPLFNRRLITNGCFVQYPTGSYTGSCRSRAEMDLGFDSASSMKAGTGVYL